MPGIDPRLSIPLTHISQIDQTLHDDDFDPLKHKLRYLPVTLGTTACLALPDSGNTWRNVISEDLMTKLGYNLSQLHPLPNHRVSSANKRAPLTVLGELPTSLSFRIHGCPAPLKTKPAVIRHLHTDFNMSVNFMRAHGINEIHTENCVQIGSQKIPLVSANEYGQPEQLVLIKETKTIPANSIGFFEIHTKKKSPIPIQEGLLQGNLSFLENTNCCPLTSAVVTLEDGITTGSAINIHNHDIVLPAGTHYGYISALPESPPQTQRAPLFPPKTTQWQKRRWIDENFKLSTNPLLQNPRHLEAAFSLLLRHWDVFSQDGQYGKTHLIQHEIHLEPGPPIREKFRPLNPALEEDLKKTIIKWKNQDVIESSSSPWSFALVPVPKKNGKIRWATDYRRLNQRTIRDSIPLPLIEDNLAKLSKSQIFSCIDGAGAFLAIPMHPRDKEKTAFSTPFGLYQYKRMPFGLMNAPATYTRLVQRVLEGIPPEMALPYLDDTCVHSVTFEEHLIALDQVLSAHQEAGLKLEPEKCTFFTTELNYLGHTISGQGIQPTKEYTRVIREWPIPRTKTHIRAWLGKVGYYRRFVPNFAALAAPWNEFTGKTSSKDEKEPIVVTPEMEKVFHQLNVLLTEAPILAYPQFDSDHPFILDTDWSQGNSAIGGVLSQVQDGQERVICYGGKKLNKSQRNYAPTKGELFAVIYFIRHWKYYLQYKKFLLRTDHRALQWIHKMEAPSGMIARWLQTLSNFSFDVEYRKGKDHGNADGLSRAPHLDELSDSSEEESATVAPLRAEPLTNWNQLLQEQNQDSTIRAILPLVKDQAVLDPVALRKLSPSTRIYHDLLPQLFLSRKGLLYRLTALGQSVICVPDVLQNQVIKTAHETGGHQGLEQTCARLREKTFFPHMRKRVWEFLKACRRCFLKDPRCHPQRHTLVSQGSGYPFQALSIDFVGPLQKSRKSECEHILTIQCRFSKWIEAFPVTNATAAAVVMILEKEIICRYGIPESIHSDQGKPFIAKLTQQVAREFGIKWSLTPAYNPKSNPVERLHRELGKMLRAITYDDPPAWEDVLPQALFALRTAVHASLGSSPYRLLFGREATQPLDFLFGRPPKLPSVPTVAAQYAQDLRDRIDRAQRQAREQLSQATIRQRNAYQQEKKKFLVGNQVWLFTPAIKVGNSKKLSTYWSGPWTVVNVLSDLLYEIKPDPDWISSPKHQTVSIDRLRAYESTASIPPPRLADLPMANDELAECILPPDSESEDELEPPVREHTPVPAPDRDEGEEGDDDVPPGPPEPEAPPDDQAPNNAPVAEAEPAPEAPPAGPAEPEGQPEPAADVAPAPAPAGPPIPAPINEAAAGNEIPVPPPPPNHEGGPVPPGRRPPLDVPAPAPVMPAAGPARRFVTETPGPYRPIEATPPGQHLPFSTRPRIGRTPTATHTSPTHARRRLQLSPPPGLRRSQRTRRSPDRFSAAALPPRLRPYQRAARSARAHPPRGHPRPPAIADRLEDQIRQRDEEDQEWLYRPSAPPP